MSLTGLHSAKCSNRFEQSFPTLIIIGVYERYLAEGQKWRESGSAQNLYNSLTRKVKKIPILDLIGSSSTDMYDAIFDVEVSDDLELFDSDEEPPHEPPSPSHDSLRPPSISVPAGPQAPSRRRHTSLPRSPSARSKSGRSPTASPRRRKDTLPPMIQTGSGEVPTVGPRSPLSKLFLGRREPSGPQVERMSAATARVEALLEDVRVLPVNKLRDEMKELQVSVCAGLLRRAD